MATNGNINHHDQYAAPAPPTEASASADSPTEHLPKVEVGWYFVEQYYTTMSKSPERLHVSPAPVNHHGRGRIDHLRSCSTARRHSLFAVARLRSPTSRLEDM